MVHWRAHRDPLSFLDAAFPPHIFALRETQMGTFPLLV